MKDLHESSTHRRKMMVQVEYDGKSHQIESTTNKNASKCGISDNKGNDINNNNNENREKQNK